eukprot:1151312-Pelagomonas_calceolata.AAC.9
MGRDCDGEAGLFRFIGQGFIDDLTSVSCFDKPYLLEHSSSWPPCSSVLCVTLKYPEHLICMSLASARALTHTHTLHRVLTCEARLPWMRGSARWRARSPLGWVASSGVQVCTQVHVAIIMLAAFANMHFLGTVIAIMTTKRLSKHSPKLPS